MSIEYTPLVFHPGEFIRDELDARGWSIETLIEKTGFERHRIEELLAGKRRLTLLDGYALEKAFGAGQEIWVNLQKHFDKKGVTPLVPNKEQQS